MNWKQILLLLPALLMTLTSSLTTASAEDSAPTDACDIDLAKVTGSSLKYYRLKTSQKTKCSLFLYPTNESYPKRTFSITGGHILASVVSEGSPVSHHSQNHSLYIFPINKRWPEAQNGKLYTPNDLQWNLNESTIKNKAEIEIPTQCQGLVKKIDPKLVINRNDQKTDKTGFHIESCKDRIVVDTGYAMGWENKGTGRPEQNPDSFSIIRTDKQSCKVQNKEIFSYYGSDEISPKYQTATEWKSFLETTARCQDLNRDFLSPPVAKPSTSTRSSGAAQ